MTGMPEVPSNQVTGGTPRSWEDGTLKQLLEAAAARPEELPNLSPFFAARVKALARERGDSRSMQLVARVAWHALPALLAVVVVLSLWAGVEVGRDAEVQDDAAMVVLQSRDVGADAPLTALLLAGGGEVPPKGGTR